MKKLMNIRNKNNNSQTVNISDPKVQKWVVQEMELAMNRLNVSLPEVQRWLTQKKIPSDPNKKALYECISNYAEMMFPSNNNNPFILNQIMRSPQKQKQRIAKMQQETIDLTQEIDIKPPAPSTTHTQIRQIVPAIPPSIYALHPLHRIPTLPQIRRISPPASTLLPLPNLQFSPSSPCSPINNTNYPHNIDNIPPLDVNMTDMSRINPYLYAFPPSMPTNKDNHIKKKEVNQPKSRRKNSKNKSKSNKLKKSDKVKVKAPKRKNDVVKTEKIKSIKGIRSRGGGGIIKPMRDEYYRLVSRVDIEGKLQDMKWNGMTLAHCFVKRTDKIILLDPMTRKELPGTKLIISEGHKCKTTECKYPHLYSQKCHWKRHALTEHCNRKFECKYCSATFRQQTQRKEHIVNKHSQSMVKWLCPYGCDGVFSQFRGVVRHVKFDRKCNSRNEYFDETVVNKLKEEWDNDVMKEVLKFKTNISVDENDMVSKEMKIKIREKIKNMFN